MRFDLWQLIEPNRAGFFAFFSFMIINPTPTKEFVILKNSTARDRRISAESLGVLTHVLSYSEQFEASADWLKATFNFGRHKADKVVAELKQFGYLEILPTRAEFGKIAGWQWNFYGIPKADLIAKNPNVGKSDIRQKSNKNPDVGFSDKLKKPTVGKSDIHIKKTRQLKKTNKKELKKDDAAARGNGNGNGIKTTAPSPLDYLANFCFSVPFGKAGFLSETQSEKLKSAVVRLENIGADFSALPYFIDFWRNDWKSFDKKFQKYQPPRPEQIAEYWFEFIESPAETTRRMQIETEFDDRIKTKYDTKNQTANFDDFAGIEFN